MELEFEYRGYTHLGVTIYTEKSKKRNWKLFRKERVKSPRGVITERFLNRNYGVIVGYTTPNFEHTDRPIKPETLLPKVAKSKFKQHIERRYKSAYQRMFEHDVNALYAREKAILPTEETIFMQAEFYETLCANMVPLGLPFFKYNEFSTSEKYYIGNVGQTYATEYKDEEPYFIGISGDLSEKSQKIEALKTIGAEILKIRQEISDYHALHTRGYDSYGEQVIQASYPPEAVMKFL